jgi:hypothetical protein
MTPTTEQFATRCHRAPCVHQALARNGHRGSGTVAKGQQLDDSDNGVSAVHKQKFADDSGWSGAGSNRRPSAFQGERQSGNPVS